MHKLYQHMLPICSSIFLRKIIEFFAHIIWEHYTLQKWITNVWNWPAVDANLYSGYCTGQLWFPRRRTLLPLERPKAVLQNTSGTTISRFSTTLCVRYLLVPHKGTVCSTYGPSKTIYKTFLSALWKNNCLIHLLVRILVL